MALVSPVLPQVAIPVGVGIIVGILLMVRKIAVKEILCIIRIPVSGAVVEFHFIGSVHPLDGVHEFRTGGWGIDTILKVVVEVKIL